MKNIRGQITLDIVWLLKALIVGVVAFGIIYFIARYMIDGMAAGNNWLRFKI
jgi:hypothetical protein